MGFVAVAALLVFALLCQCSSSLDERDYNAEFAPEGVERDIPDSGDEKWSLLYPPPQAPTELKLAPNDRMLQGMKGRNWPSILVMGNLETCSKVRNPNAKFDFCYTKCQCVQARFW